MIDFDTLRIIWWLISGFLFTGFAVLGGIDLGCGILLPLVAKNDIEKRITIQSIKATWESNQVWFVTAGGALFAAWPLVYAITFSLFYPMLFLVLIALILRPVGFEYRNKLEFKNWRALWDRALFIGGFLPSLIFGIAVGNLLEGINFSFDNFMIVTNKTSLSSLFSFFTLLCGVLGVAMMITQGATFLMMKTEGKIFKRSMRFAVCAPIVTIALFAMGGYMMETFYGYEIVGRGAANIASNPMSKAVTYIEGAWLLNYKKYPLITTIPVIAFFSLAATITFSLFKKSAIAFVSSSLSVVAIMSTVGLSMFPFILPSKLDYQSSLTIWDASSSYNSLIIMLGVVVIFMPIVITYIGIANKIMLGKIREKDLEKQQDEDSY
jgi:cytochrome bd ubiquinol oxidase subunit II